VTLDQNNWNWKGVTIRGGLTTLVWKDRWEVYVLPNMDPPPAEGNFCDNSNHPMKPHIMEWYNWHMGYVNNSDRMAKSYSMSRRTFKWTTKLFFHFLDVTVVYRYLHVGLNIPTEISGPFWWGIWLRKLERAKIVPPLDWLEDQVQSQKMFCDSRVTITSTGQRNRQSNSAAICVLLAAKERAQCISVPDVMWVCVWRLILRNITQK